MRSPAICTAENSSWTTKPSAAPMTTSVMAATTRKPGVGSGSEGAIWVERSTDNAIANAPLTGTGMLRELNGGASSTNPVARAVPRSSAASVAIGTSRSTGQVRSSSRGSESNRLWVKLTSSESTQLPVTSSAIATAIIFGTNDSVGSWIWVAAWNSEIRKPTSRAVSSTGAATFAATIMVWAAMSVTSASLIVRLRTRSAPRSLALPAMLARPSFSRRSWLATSRVGTHEGCGDQRPAVDDDEEQQLERQRDDRRRHHHHPHGHQRRADQH